MQFTHRVAAATTVAAVIGLLAAALPALSQTVDLDGFEVETFARGLREPAAFDFIGPDELFVFERRTGNVRWIRDGRVVRRVYRAKVNGNGSRGGLGLAIDPDFDTNGYVYLFYSASSRSGGPWLENRLERLEFDGTDLINAKTLLTIVKESGQDGPDQNGGVLRFGPDGKLYGLVGSLGRRALAATGVEQNTTTEGSSGAGVVFRIDADGGAAGGNPFISNPNSDLHRWFAYGVRDGVGLAFDPVSDSLWFTERGPGVYDEINRAVAGMNSGWLKIIGPDSRDAAHAANGNAAADERDLVMIPRSKYSDPAFSFADSTGIGPLTFVDTRTYGKALRNRLLVGDANGDLHSFELNRKRKKMRLSGPLRDRVADGAVEAASTIFGSGFGDVSDLRVGPDGLLYALDRAGGRILRVVPVLNEEEETATYRVTFNATWSAATHPDSFPGNPHFSGLIGGTHNNKVTFWQKGATATAGIKNMAELGTKTALNNEVMAAIAAGTAERVLSGGGIGLSPGSVTLRFEIGVDFPRVSLVSMMAPSPDWFVGVDSLSLFRGGAWVDEIVVDLFPYDAGTDSGTSYGSADDPTSPRVPIALIDGSPFAVNGDVAAVGRFVFRRVQ